VALDRYWMARSWGQEAVTLLTPVLERPEARTDPLLFGQALLVAVLACRVAGDVASALRYGEQAVEFARQLDDGRLLIQSLAVLSSMCYYVGEAERGVPFGQEAVERARPLGDDVLLAEALSGYLQSLHPVDPVRSGKLYDEAIACTERSGDQQFAFILHNNAGVHALCVGDIAAARAHLEAAAQASKANGENSGELAVNLGWVRRQDGDQDDARCSFEDALRMSRRSGEGSNIAYAVLGLATLAADAGQWSRACVLHGMAQAALDRTGEIWQEPEASYRRESLAQIRAHLDAAQSERDYARGLALSSDEIADLASRQDLRKSRPDRALVAVPRTARPASLPVGDP
jgi:tetratricopeptide (TPR) repeat protein